MKSVRSSVLSLGLAVGMALGSPVALAAEPAVASDARVLELQTLFAESQRQVDRFNATRDPKHLVVARELLTQWLIDHQVLYGSSPEAIAQRSTIEQQIAMMDAELGDGGAAPRPAPAPAVTPMPPAQPEYDPGVVLARRRADAWVTGGSVALTLGAATVRGASLPLWALRDASLREADEQEFRVDQRVHLERAQRRQAGAVATLSVGVPLVTLGVALLAVGATKRSRARRMTLLPQGGRGYAGAGLRVRF
ncbi:MAG: hypothetical protein AB1Z98_17190 [Nannocystaceae bacterium]